jgi:integrase
VTAKTSRKAKISNQTVAGMKPGDVIADVEISGFSARCWGTGAVTYSLRYRNLRGEQKRILLARHGNVTPTEARKLAKQRAGEVASGQDPATEQKVAAAIASNTVGIVWDKYVKRELATKRSADEQKRSFDRLVRPRIGDRSIYELCRSDITKLFDTIAEDNGRTMADRMLAYLGRCFRQQQVHDDDFVSPIVRGMTRVSAKKTARSRVLDDDELRAIWKVTEHDAYGAMLRFILLTAARRSEASKMKWDEVNGATWTLPASRNKAKVDLLRPLSKDAAAILAALPRSNGYVFPGTRKSISGFARRKARLDKQCGVSDWTVHDLRRTARSLLSRAGISSDIAEMCLGHTLTGVRSVYDRHAYASEKAAAFESLAALISQVVGSDSARP